jgi:hypothetical protein
MSGGDLYVLRDILGHKSIQMTQRYAHLSPTYKRAMVDRMEKMWENGPKAQLQPESGAITTSGHQGVTDGIPSSTPMPPKPSGTRALRVSAVKDHPVGQQ